MLKRMLLLVVVLAGCGPSTLVQSDAGPELVDAGPELDAGPGCPCPAGEHLDPATLTCVTGTGHDACDGGAR